jgi:hypothetical protein
VLDVLPPIPDLLECFANDPERDNSYNASCGVYFNFSFGKYYLGKSPKGV